MENTVRVCAPEGHALPFGPEPFGPEPFGPEPFGPEPFGPELTAEGLTAEGLTAEGSWPLFRETLLRPAAGRSGRRAGDLRSPGSVRLCAQTHTFRPRPARRRREKP